MVEIIIWVLAIYGAMKIVEDFLEMFEIKKILKGEINVVIKVFNKQENIEEIVEKILKETEDINVRVEDAGSTDKTFSILKKMEEQYSNLQVLRM
ncbi:MAG: glycosyltransferase [Clostridia bacterium]|nr:glycosyltransferase [Clostridia bacterium]